MSKISLSLAGPLMTGALLVGSSVEAEVLVGFADAFSGPDAEARYIAGYREKYPTLPADPADLSPTNYVALKVWAEAVEIAGSFDATSVADVLRSHTFNTMFGTLGFDEKGDVTGIEMWSWYRWENGQMVEKAPEGNCIGIAVATGSLNNQTINNIALDNILVDLADGNVDCDNNRWRSNLFASSAAGPAFSDLLPACIR